MKRIALADCNNFFVSCERVFNPKLVGKPVVVLSSNDACVIARSNEAKKLGIIMGQAAYQCKEIFAKHKVTVLSSNFALYGDMSARVMDTLSSCATDIEIYSVDESFLYFPKRFTPFANAQEENAYFTAYATYVRQMVQKKVGIPITIGMGSTKTLAKIANHIAKKNPAYNGVLDLTNHPQLHEILATIDVADIWGIGYRYTKLLHSKGITNAYQLTQCDDAWIRKHMTIVGLKTVTELRGTACFTLHDTPEPRKSLTVSRAFGKNVTEIRELQEAVAYHATTAAQKLRKQAMIASNISVFVCFTNYGDPHRHYTTTTIELAVPTAYTPTLIAAAQQCLRKLFKRGLLYKKVGIIIDDFYSADFVQMPAFGVVPDPTKHTKLMQTIDGINDKMGKNKLFFAACGTNHTWHAKRAHKSAAYTTNWHELLTIKI